MEYTLTTSAIIDILLSTIMAFLANVTNFYFLAWASPLTYQVAGHMKTILVLVCGVILYDSYPSNRSVMGMILALTGVIAYTEENRRQTATSAATKNEENSSDQQSLLNKKSNGV